MTIRDTWMLDEDIEDDHRDPDSGKPAPGCFVRHADRDDIVAEVWERRDALLIAAAPELVRALLSLEWLDAEGSTDLRRCPVCDGTEREIGDDYHVARGHESGCKLDAALRKAGAPRPPSPQSTESTGDR